MPPAKHSRIFEHLREAIDSGRLGASARVPSENELAARFRVSRPTAARALRDLRALGLVERKPGSGTYVRPKGAAPGQMFGLLIPALGDTEIFEPICGQIGRDLERQQNTLLWGTSSSGEGHRDAAGAERLCAQYVERRVAGVFFAPIELAADHDAANGRILEALAAARIPVVLLDRDVVRFPDRSAYDVVSIDHRRIGYQLASHLLSDGYRRVAFLARPRSAPTVDLRIAGYREALLDAGIAPQPEWIERGDPEDEKLVRQLVARRKAEAIICANDVTAAQLMVTLDTLGFGVPDDVAVVGVDDVRYARLLRVPLTTVRQPCHEIGRCAVSAMLERIAQPDLPARDILLPAPLVVRRSCGRHGGRR